MGRITAVVLLIFFAGAFAVSQQTRQAPPASGSDYVSRMLLEPLAARFASNGLGVTFGPDFATWVATQLPGEGEAALVYLDRVLAPALVASLPPGATTLTARVANGRPVLVPEVTTGDNP